MDLCAAAAAEAKQDAGDKCSGGGDERDEIGDSVLEHSIYYFHSRTHILKTNCCMLFKQSLDHTGFWLPPWILETWGRVALYGLVAAPEGFSTRGMLPIAHR